MQQMVATEVTCRLLKTFETGERLYQQFRDERFKAKTVKLSAIILYNYVPYCTHILLALRAPRQMSFIAQWVHPQ